jgi:hypothetical protein
MLKTKSLGVRILSALLGALGAALPIVLLLLDEMPYDMDAFLAYAFFFGVPGFLIPFLVTRFVAGLIQRSSEGGGSSTPTRW